uniref:HSF-type DNA-binding domain-containing protein n=1 Tax=Catagonus wagneri TaxID=51154 RepID=A0A8C3WES6_9CETA
MASPSTHEARTATQAPSADAEPTPGPSPDTKGDSRETPEKRGDGAESPEPGPRDDPPAPGPSRGAVSSENGPGLGLSFPRKLWMVVEDDAFTSVRWSDAGDTVLIDQELFQREVLCCSGAERILETDSLKGFIGLMNLHGFSKIRPAGPSAGSIYRNARFQRDKPLLVPNIQRSKKQLLPTRRSPRIHHDDSIKEAASKTQKEAPSAPGPSATQAFTFPGIRSRSSVAGQAVAHQPLGEQGGPSGEGTSRNVTFVSPATAGSDSAGQVPTSPPVNPDYSSVMSLYNTCYSILLVALSVMAPNEAPEGDEEQEGSSDYKCALCEQFKDNPGP